MSATEVEQKCPACSHVHNDSDCAECPCEYDTAFCEVCGWLDCECDDTDKELGE